MKVFVIALMLVFISGCSSTNTAVEVESDAAKIDNRDELNLKKMSHPVSCPCCVISSFKIDTVTN